MTTSPLVMARWFPASVVLPRPGETPLAARTARVYITAPQADRDAELVVFLEPGDDPAWAGRVDLDQTPQPPSGVTHPPPNLDIVTEHGLAIVTPRGGCGCGNRLRSWQPAWGTDVTPWRTS